MCKRYIQMDAGISTHVLLHSNQKPRMEFPKESCAWKIEGERRGRRGNEDLAHGGRPF
jgi:hypothetical protein